jgi:hypothetical protein
MQLYGILCFLILVVFAIDDPNSIFETALSDCNVDLVPLALKGLPAELVIPTYYNWVDKAFANSNLRILLALFLSKYYNEILKREFIHLRRNKI